MQTPICTAYGQIKQVLLLYRCPTCDDPSQVGAVFKSLIDALGPQVEFFILIQLNNGSEVFTIPSSQPNVHLIAVNPAVVRIENFLTQWTQDVVLPFYDNGITHLLFDDSRIDSQVIQCLNTKTEKFQFKAHHQPTWQGGNILPVSGKEPFLLVGASILQEYVSGLPAKQKQEAQQKLEKNFAAVFGGAKIYWLGKQKTQGQVNGGQPLFHLDLYLMPVGIVPALNKERILIFVAEVKPDYAMAGYTHELAELAQALDKTANWFANDKQHPKHLFVVKRLPLLAFEDKEHIASYTNCLVENTTEACRIFLPDYRPQPTNGNGVNPERLKKITAIQEIMTTALQEIDIQPVWIDQNFYEMTRKEGALHCLTKVLKRTL